MNYIKITIIILFVLSTISANGQNSRKEKKKEKQLAIASMVDSIVNIKNINFVVSTIVPQSMPSRQTSDGYFISIKKDTLNCHLPYFGRSTSPIFGGSDKLSLIIKDQKIKVSEEEYSKKKGYTLYFECKNDSTQETWDIRMQIFSSGYGSINAKTQSKDGISYLGDIL